MSRLQKLKLENIRKANELLEKGHNEQYPPQVVILKPSENVTNTSTAFVNKMSNLKEEYLTEGDEGNPNLMLLNAFTQLESSNEDEVVNVLKPCIGKAEAIIMSGQVVHPLGPGQIKPFTKGKGVREQREQINLNEEPEKDTYWMITKANRDNLIKMGGTAEEIGKSATNNFQKYCK